MNKQEIERALEWANAYLEYEKHTKATYEDTCGTGDMTEDERKEIYEAMDSNISLFATITETLTQQLTNGWIPVSDKHPVKHEDELEEQFRNICQELFKDCETEQDLNERYEELRQIIVCEMSDRAEYLGIDPDTL